MQHEGAQALIVLPSAQVTVPQRAAIMEHVVDLRAARTLGLTIPSSVLLRADKVLE
jgi:hypothetical protein